MTSSPRTFPLSVTALFYRGPDLFLTTSVAKRDRNDSIVGYSGSVLRAGDAKPEQVWKSKVAGALAGAALASGDLAIATTDNQIVVLGADGKVRRQFASGLPPYHSPDFVVAGGTPERLFVASRAYSNAKSFRAEEWDATTWARGKSIAFTTTNPLSVSARGVARTMGKGYAKADSWGVQEYAWKGAPKAIKTPTQRSSWCVSTPSGWLVSDSQTAAFVDPSGTIRWTTAEPLIAACKISDTQIALLTWNALVIVEAANGRAVEHQPLEVGEEESWQIPCPIAASPSGSVAFASESRIRVVDRQTPAAAVRDASAAVLVQKAPSPEKVAKAKADQEASAASAVVGALEEIVSEVAGSDDVKVFRKAHARLKKLDVVGAADEPKNAKRIAKCEKTLRARVKALSGSAAGWMLEDMLDTLTST